LSTAAKLTQLKYGTISQLANTEYGRNPIKSARTDTHRNTTSINAQSGRRKLKNNGDHKKWKTKFTAYKMMMLDLQTRLRRIGHCSLTVWKTGDGGRLAELGV
jgi:hypothetical protein